MLSKSSTRNKFLFFAVVLPLSTEQKNPLLFTYTEAMIIQRSNYIRQADLHIKA